MNVANDLIRISENAETPLGDLIDNVPPGVLQPIKQFLKILSSHQAELRFAFDDGASKRLSAGQIASAVERLERDVDQQDMEVRGVFRGLTRESVVFDLRQDDGTVITGKVADDLSEEDLDRIDELTNSPCTASLRKTTVTSIGGAASFSYVLLDARPFTSQELALPDNAEE